jgi:signal transduction histidine kinase
MKELVEDFEDQINQKKAVVKIDNLPTIDAIPSQLRQVFQNLLSNALKFVRSGITPEIKISVDLVSTNDLKSTRDENGEYCRIIFADNGIGFNQTYTDRIFLIFQRLHASSDYEGTGIGLAIAKKIIEQHGGRIGATSIENQGSEFTFTLPLTHKNDTE